MKILVISTNEYGDRFARHIRRKAPASWEVAEFRYSVRLPVVIDDPDGFIPEGLPRAELLLYVGQDRQLAELLPELAQACGARAVIAPVDHRVFLPSGLANQNKRRLAARGVDAVFPVPFCSLTEGPNRNPLIREFATHFGRARVALKVNEDRIQEVHVYRGAPCGNTHFVAERLPGTDVSEADEQTARLFHAHPCMGSMEMDFEIGDTILHVAGYHIKNAIRRELRRRAS